MNVHVTRGGDGSRNRLPESVSSGGLMNGPHGGLPCSSASCASLRRERSRDSCGVRESRPSKSSGRHSTGLGAYLADRLQAVAVLRGILRPAMAQGSAISQGGTAENGEPLASALAGANSLPTDRQSVPPAGRDWRRRPAGKPRPSPKRRSQFRPGRLDRLEERRVCAWVGEEAVAIDEGGGGGGSFPETPYADGMLGPPPAAIEGTVEAGGPWSKAPP
ncbi:MAG: hypothetical protein ACKO38_04590, partial [Planctomycetota bacterium]